jgi:hypothetical protein
MRRVLVDVARARRRAKRGGADLPVTSDVVEHPATDRRSDGTRRALNTLETLDPRQSRRGLRFLAV